MNERKGQEAVGIDPSCLLSPRVTGGDLMGHRCRSFLFGLVGQLDPLLYATPRCEQTTEAFSPTCVLPECLTVCTMDFFLQGFFLWEGVIALLMFIILQVSVSFTLLRVRVGKPSSIYCDSITSLYCHLLFFSSHLGLHFITAHPYTHRHPMHSSIRSLSGLSPHTT